jgi:hypothetical protein
MNVHTQMQLFVLPVFKNASEFEPIAATLYHRQQNSVLLLRRQRDYCCKKHVLPKSTISSMIN